MATWIPTFMRDFAAYLQNPNVYMYGRWDVPRGNMEGGVDVGSPGGTPVYAIADGEIIGAGNFWHSGSIYTPGSGNPGYGVVTTRVNVPGHGLQDLYYQHIDLDPSITFCMIGGTPCKGQKVKKGDRIGTIRSNVGMLEMGFNANWWGVWGHDHPGAWPDDPRPMLVALLNTGEPASLGGKPGAGTGDTTGSVAGQVNSSTPGIPGSTSTSTGNQSLVVGPLIDALNNAMAQVAGWIGPNSFAGSWLFNPVRFMKFMVGSAIVLVAVYMLINSNDTATGNRATLSEAAVGASKALAAGV